MSEVARNWSRIERELAAYPGARLVAVTKAQPWERIREAVDLGVTILGNNYVQEGERLRAALGNFTGRWHFIGHIQSRKARDLVDYHCVESLDRIKVARALGEKLREKGRSLDVLVEVNIGREPQKSGVPPENLETFLAELAEVRELRVKGLMALPPPLDPPAKRAPFFRELTTLRKRFRLEILSAGTSDDYPVALAEGANLIRLGTALFGARVTAPLSNEKKGL